MASKSLNILLLWYITKNYQLQHLFKTRPKIKTPWGFSTQNASLTPARRSSPQLSLSSFPYFLPCHPFSPIRSRCGGSKTTTENDEASKGNLRKSAIISRIITNCRPSQRVCRSAWISLNTARSSCSGRHNNMALCVQNPMLMAIVTIQRRGDLTKMKFSDKRGR